MRQRGRSGSLDRPILPGMGDSSWRNVKIGDLLPDDVLRELEPIMEDIASGTIDVSDGQKAILALLEPQRQDLLEKGVLADYLGWQLVAVAAQSGGRL